MKPSFALDFRDGVIALLHRTSRGWQQVGSTPVDAPDLAEALSYLRSTALGLSPRGVSTKLVIPNEQILYTQVHAPGPEVAKRKRQIKAALEGLTPYKVDDLVYDWWGSGPEVHVAVVARETLTEAEAFAVEHRFNPVSFVASPDSVGFTGEPFFGPSALAATLLAEGEKVERDQDPIAVMAREYPRAETPPEPAPKVAPPEAPAPVTPAPVTPAPVTPVETPAPPAETPPPPPAEIEPERPLEIEPKPPNEIQPAPPPEIEPAPQALEIADPEANLLPDFRAARAPAAGASSFDPKAMAIDLVDEAPMAIDVADDQIAAPTQADRPREAASPIPASQPRQHAPVPAQPAAAAFASRRAGQEAGQVSAALDPAREVEKPVVMPAAAGITTTAEFAAAAAAAKARKTPAVGPAPSQRPTVPRPALARPPAPMPSASRDAVPFPTKAPAAKFLPGKSAKPGVATPGIAGLRRERNVVALPKAATAAGNPDAPPTTAKPGAKRQTGLDGRPLPVRGKPRYLGLILTVILLIALALVAAWSSFYLSSNETDPGAAPPSNAVASVTPDTGGPAESAPDPAASDALPTVEDEALADGQDPALAANTVAEVATPDAAAPDTVAADTVADTPGADTPVDVTAADEAVAQTAAATAPAPVPEPAPETSVVTDAAVVAVPGNDPQDEIFLAAADTPPQTSDPLILPQVFAGSDPPPLAAPPPPPFGTVYTFDAEGRIQPTPEGILTPEGVLLIAGPPKVVPPVRPTALVAPEPAVPEPAAPEPAATAPAAETATAPPEPVISDPALAGKKPRSRPPGLVDDAATADRQGEVLAPGPNSRFASLRPRERPPALTETVSVDTATPEPANGASAASLAANGIQGSTSTLAVVVSRKPAARPSGMAQAVDAAVAAAVQAPDPQETFVVVAPEAEAEPEVESAAPRVPSNASVAKQATVKDALNLSRVALLGIFSTSSGRYAMIRQPGGGIKKVVVGDTIDGGRIAAITATAVEYQKGGRIVTLSLPTG